MMIRAGKGAWGGLSLDGEQAFILTLARAYALGEDPCSTLESLAATIPQITSWSQAELLLRVHRCTALAYAVLRDPLIKDAALVPDVFLSRTRDWYSAAFTRTVMEPAVLHRVTDALNANDIPALLIKGLALGTWLYRDAASREHDDIDLIIPAEMGSQADEVLLGLGYKGGYRPPMYPGESPATASYAAPADGISIDLSFDPLHVFWQSPKERRVSFDGWWTRRQELRIANRTVPSLGPEDQLLQLARHLQFHGYFRINWWVDVLLLLRHFGDKLDWELIGSEARYHGVTGGLYRVLELSQSVYGLQVPCAALRHLQPGRVVRGLHRRVWSDMLVIPRERPLREQEGTPIAPRFLSPGGVHPVAGLALFVLDRQRVKHLRYLGQRVVPPPSWLHRTYGAGSYPKLMVKHWQALRALRRRVQKRVAR